MLCIGMSSFRQGASMSVCDKSEDTNPWDEALSLRSLAVPGGGLWLWVLRPYYKAEPEVIFWSYFQLPSSSLLSS